MSATGERLSSAERAALHLLAWTTAWVSWSGVSHRLHAACNQLHIRRYVERRRGQGTEGTAYHYRLARDGAVR